ncbi:ATP-dependent helicase [Conexibacter sp. CPCC 206217]|uniref:ATP-dependent helicase n=1 Tax=Conexibacter sp. CPCC 206217 TaxID=3064574 RepID=UPI002727D2BD|nr:ATP-dependent helicase [Conexibacter sp. CPCC 206217]MDO8208973.1 ATP-dependent helicase [Conexibacter sp. CPCC 206217]
MSVTEQAAALLGAAGSDTLTSEQQQVAAHGTGPLLVTAGPGAGKTSTITQRIVRLVRDSIARPSEILAMTFTVSAANELRDRLADPRMLGQAGARGVMVGTFHSVCAHVLRNHAELFGRTDAFSIYDADELGRIVDQLLADPSRAELREQLDRFGHGPRAEIVRVMSLAKTHLLTPTGYVERSHHPMKTVIAQVWQHVSDELAANNALDFDDLLVFAYALFMSRPSVLLHYRRRWPWVLVDEHQDNNWAQIWLVALLAGSDGNVTALADDDQAIYRFRGAEVDGTLRFRFWFPNATTIALGQNFRSRAEIVMAARRCVEHNRSRTQKVLVSARGPGGRIDTPVFANEHAEAEWIRTCVEETIGSGVPVGEIYVVARNAYLTQPLQRPLTEAGIPYRVVGGLGFYERAVVKDAIAYLELIANPRDRRAFRRAVQSPRRKIGDATVDRVIETAREEGVEITTACSVVAADGSVRQRDTRAALDQFAAAFAGLRRRMLAGEPVDVVVKAALSMPGGLVAHHQGRASRRDDADQAIEDLRTLCRAAAAHRRRDPAATLAAFVQSAMLDADDADGADDVVRISTIHRAKGCEAHTVIVVGCEERVLPSWRATESADPRDLEEERRLFYVAATRARKRLILTRSNARRGRPTAGPSRFLVEAGVVA